MKIVKIGRGPGNDVNIDDMHVSSSHCQIIMDDYGNFKLVDVNSTNGTYVNGVKRRGEVALNRTDIIRVGNTTLPWQNYFTGGGYTPPSGGGCTVTVDPYPPTNPPQPASKPDSFLVWSILATFCCCAPFGIASIVYSSKVDSLWASGDYNGAIESARKAKMWFWWAFAIGLVMQVIVLIYYVIVIGVSALHF